MTVSRYIGRFLIAAVVIFCSFFFATLFFIHAANASDLGPPPGPGGANCQVSFIDPPYAALVTAVVTLDGQTFPPVTVHYDVEETHRANFPWTADELAILNVAGPHSWSAVFGWNYGTGTTTLSGSLTCTEIPPTTTTTSPPPPPVTTTTTKTAVVPPPPAPSTNCDATPTPAGCLPHTGSDSTGILLAAGVAAVAVGGAVARKFRWLGR